MPYPAPKSESAPSHPANLLRVRRAGILSRHPGPVRGYVIKGTGRYLEHDGVASAGSDIFEPPGEIHTLMWTRTWRR